MTCSFFICRNAEGVYGLVSECLTGTWETNVENTCSKSTVNKKL